MAMKLYTLDETCLENARAGLKQPFSPLQLALSKLVSEADILRRADSHLAAARQTTADGLSPDFVVIDLRSAWEKLGEITGETVGEDIIDQIFSQFCIGK